MNHLPTDAERDDFESQQAGIVEQIQQQGAQVAQEAIAAVKSATVVEDLTASLGLSAQELEDARTFLGMNKTEWKVFLASHFTTRMKDAASSMMIMNQLGGLIILISMFATIRSECTPCENAFRFSIVLLILSTLAFSSMYVLATIKDHQDSNQSDNSLE